MAKLDIHSNVELHYADQGKGQIPWLMFNGAGLPLEFWDEVADVLVGNHRIIRFDQRNAGSTVANGRFSLHDIASDAYRLLQHLAVDQVMIAGHAWGGRVAQVFARDYSFVVNGMVICGTGGQVPATADPADQTQLRQCLREGNRKGWEQALERLFVAPGYAQRDSDGFRRISDLLWERPAGVKSTWNPQIAPSESYWGQSRVPTLLLYGDADHFGTRENAKDLASQIPGSKLLLLEDTGHFLIRERHQEIADQLRNFAAVIQGGRP